jgi:TatD DNase family protein
VLARARAAGVSHVVVIGESLAGSERAAGLARAVSGLSASAGVHPHDAETWSAEAAARVRDLLASPEIVAVGETGLDYHYMHAPRSAQRAAFDAQLGLARELGKAVVVHAREADDDVAAALRQLDDRSPVVLHSFSSGDAVWEAGRAINAYFSFSGMITFKNWRLTGRVAECPGDRLLLETDAPYLAPVPQRGRRNEPAFVRHVAERAAALRREPVDTLLRQTGANARRCFGPRLEVRL